ncbi:MAG: Mut7-C RNAse domain-containing protein [Nitrososphaerales archaeon]
MSSVRFVVDGMLGNLARKLRLFGFDTLYYNDINDERLIEIGKQEGRVLLTCDKKLFQRAMNAGVSGVLLNGSGNVDDMVHVLKNSGIYYVEFLPDKSRCPLCNGMLDIRDKNSINKLIPDQVLNIHERFYFCKQCNKVYWEGSHMKKLKEFALTVKRRLGNAS